MPFPSKKGSKQPFFYLFRNHPAKWPLIELGYSKGVGQPVLLINKPDLVQSCRHGKLGDSGG